MLYVYSATTCDQLSFAPISITNRPIYYVGSDIELTPGQILLVQDLHSPSKKQCVEVLVEVTEIEPTHSYVSTYDNCLDCFSANTLIALVQSCNPGSEFFSEFPIIVSNLYEIGDILSIPELHFFGESESENILYFNDCFTIIDIIPFEETELIPLPNIVEYSPSKSCEECTSCLGRYYSYTDCENPDEVGFIYSHQNLVTGTTILFQSGTTSCKFIDYSDSIIPFFTLNDFISTFSGSPVVNSTVVYSSCTECFNIGIWSEEIKGNGYVDFNNPLPIPENTWGIFGPDFSNCDDQGWWTYVKYQTTQSGSITLNFAFEQNDGPEFDWAFYYVSPNEPIGDTNIIFDDNVFANSDSGGTITINYNAGDWISIGVYSNDGCEGPGVLFISAPQIQENPPYTLHEFTTCNGDQGYVNIPSDSQLVNPVIKANYGTTPAVCGTIGDSVTEIGIGELYYSNVDDTYSSCEDCKQLYGVTLKECKTGQLYYLSMTLENIAKVLNQGPIFANGGTECYELLDSCILPNTSEYIPILFYGNCLLCNQPLSAGTETIICEQVCISGGTGGYTVVQVSPPHPVWTNQRGKAVVLLDAISLGGMFGLNN
jgi:hypothetical protein